MALIRQLSSTAMAFSSWIWTQRSV